MQTYYARSMFSDPQNIASALSTLVGILALPEVTAIIPVEYMPAILAFSGALSLVLRTAYGVRPVAAIAPGNTKAVQVKSLQEPDEPDEP